MQIRISRPGKRSYFGVRITQLRLSLCDAARAFKYVWYEGGRVQLEDIRRSTNGVTWRRRYTAFTYNPPKSRKNGFTNTKQPARRLVCSPQHIFGCPQRMARRAVLHQAETLKQRNELAYRRVRAKTSELARYSGISYRRINDEEIAHLIGRAVSIWFAAHPTH